MEEERGLALFLEAGIFLGVLPPVASRSWHRCIAYSAVLLVGHFECLLCHSPAFDLAYLSTSEGLPARSGGGPADKNDFPVRADAPRYTNRRVYEQGTLIRVDRT